MITAIKLNLRELLSRLAESNSSRYLELETGEIDRKIYLQQSNLKYVYCSIQLLDQLKYYWHYFGCKKASATLQSNFYLNIQDQFSQSNIYSEVITWFLNEKFLYLSQSLELIKYLTKDVFLSAFCFDRGGFLCHEGLPVPL